MNKIILLAGALALVSGSCLDLRAQSQVDAFRLGSAHQYSGSARYQALSGAMGAVGADYSSTAQNPAGIALFRSGSKVSLTGYYMNLGNSSTWQENKHTLKQDATLNFDEFSYLTSWGTGAQTFTLGLAVRNGGRFRQDVDATTPWDPRRGSSMADYAAARLNRLNYIPTPGALNTAVSSFPYRELPWIGVLGYNAGWINHMTSPSPQFQSAYAYENAGVDLMESPSSAGLRWKEEGGVANYEVAFAGNLSPEFSLGGMLTYTSLNYKRTTSYSEGFRQRTGRSSFDGLSLDNQMEVSGDGVSFSLGAIYQPIEGLRLGLSVYTPTFYTLKLEQNHARATGYNVTTLDGSGNEITYSETTPSDAADAFAMRTPWRIGASAAYVFGRKAILSADYEYMNYSGMRLGEDYGDGISYSSELYRGDNEAIKSDFGAVHTLRLGLEYNLSKRLALRAGTALNTTPEYNVALDRPEPQIEALVTDANLHYSLPRSSMAFSLGLGYRFSPKWTMDFALTMRANRSDVYAFPAIRDEVRDEWLTGLSPISYKQNVTQAALTLSYRY